MTDSHADTCNYCSKTFKCYGYLGGEPVCNKCYKTNGDFLSKSFKGAKFIVCVEDLDSIITKEPSITIKQEYNCYCYIPKFNMYPPRPTEYFTICGTNMTNRYVIKELIKQRFNPKCNHKFLEQINLCDDGVTWDMFLGS